MAITVPTFSYTWNPHVTTSPCFSHRPSLSREAFEKVYQPLGLLGRENQGKITRAVGAMSNFTGVNGGFLIGKAWEHHGKSLKSMEEGKSSSWKDCQVKGKIRYWWDNGIRNGMMTSHSWFQWNLGLIRYSRRPFRPRHEIAKSPHLTGMFKDTLWQTNSLQTGKSPWLMGKATISTGPWLQ